MKETDIQGNWWFVLNDSYNEIYVDDKQFNAYFESLGLISPKTYILIKDSIFFKADDKLNFFGIIDKINSNDSLLFLITEDTSIQKWHRIDKNEYTLANYLSSSEDEIQKYKDAFWNRRSKVIPMETRESEDENIKEELLEIGK
jgi:hypothetical protein